MTIILIFSSSLSATAFGDTVTMQAIANELAVRHLLDPTVAAVDRFYAYRTARLRNPELFDGPLQEAMIAQPSLAAAVLFTVFLEQFAVRAGGGGERSGLQLLIKTPTSPTLNSTTKNT